MLPVYTSTSPQGHPDSGLSPGVDLAAESSSRPSPSPAQESFASSSSSSTDDGGSTVVGSETGESRENAMPKVGLTELLIGDIDVNRLHPHSDSKDPYYNRDLESIVIIPSRESETSRKLGEDQNEEEDDREDNQSTTSLTRTRTERSLFPVCEKLHRANQTFRLEKEDEKEVERDGRLSFYHQRSAALTPRHFVEKLHRKGRRTTRRGERGCSNTRTSIHPCNKDEINAQPPVSLCISVHGQERKEQTSHLYESYRNSHELFASTDDRVDPSGAIEKEREDLDKEETPARGEEEGSEGQSSGLVYKPNLHAIPIGVRTPSFLEHLRYELSETKRFWVCDLHHRDWRPIFISSYYGSKSFLTPLRVVGIRLVLCCLLLLLEGFASADVYKDLGAPMFLYFTNWNSYLISIYFILLCVISLRAVYTFRSSSLTPTNSSSSSALEQATTQQARETEEKEEGQEEEEERKKSGAPSVTSTTPSNSSSSHTVRREADLENPFASQRTSPSSSSPPLLSSSFPQSFFSSESSTPSVATSSSTQENLPRLKKSADEDNYPRNPLSLRSSSSSLRIEEEEEEARQEEDEDRGCQRAPCAPVARSGGGLAGDRQPSHQAQSRKKKTPKQPSCEFLPGYRELLSSREEIYSVNGILLAPNPSNYGAYDSVLDPQQYLLPSCLLRRRSKKKPNTTTDTNNNRDLSSSLSSSSSSPRTPLLISLTWILHTIQLIASTAVFLIFFSLLKQNGNTFPEAWYSVWKHLLIVLTTFSHSFFLTYIPIPLKHIIFAYIFIMIYLGVQTLVYLLNLSNGDGGYGYVYKVFDMSSPLRSLGVSILVLLSISVLLLIIWASTRKRNLLVDPPPSVAISAYELLQLQQQQQKEEEKEEEEEEEEEKEEQLVNMLVETRRMREATRTAKAREEEEEQENGSYVIEARIAQSREGEKKD